MTELNREKLKELGTKWRPLSDEILTEMLLDMTQEDIDRYSALLGCFADGFSKFKKEAKKAAKGESQEKANFYFYSFASVLAYIEKELLTKSQSPDAIMAIIYLLDSTVSIFGNYRVSVEKEKIRFHLTEGDK